MAIKKMKLVRASGPSSKLNKLIRTCCNDGYFHVEQAGNYISESMGYISKSEESPYLKTLQSIKELADNFGFDLEQGKAARKAIVDEYTQEYIDSVGRNLRRLNEENRSLAEQLSECNAALEKFSHFKGLDINLDEIFNLRFISARFGYLPGEGFTKFRNAHSDNPYILFIPCSSDSGGLWCIYFAPSNKEKEIDRIFASLNFEKLTVPGAAGTADEIVKNISENVEIICGQKAELEKQIGEVWKNEGEKIKAIYSKLQSLEKLFELRKYAVYNGDSCFFVGWIPANMESRLREKFDKCPEFLVEIENPDKRSKTQPPVLLRNAIFSRPYNYYVEMYGLPSYYDLDITSFVAVTYTLLFGMMFGDVGQGVVLAIAGLVMWKKMNMPLGKILIPCGIASVFFGFVFGSVFGFEEALDPVYHAIGMKGKPLEVMDSINTVLLLAIGIGVALVIIAMVINVFTNLKRSKFGSALFTENGVTGICVYVAGANLVYGFMAGKTIFSSSVSVIMLIVGMLILFNKEIIAPLFDEKKFHKPDSLMDYILQNFFECIEYVLSYFSNTVSFLRVGAFVIVHASMMMVVFTLAGDTSSVKGIIVVILGNILVICLEGLLTGIQGLRLEFYEMFSRFYEGEGRPYEPVQIKNQSAKAKAKN